MMRSWLRSSILVALWVLLVPIAWSQQQATRVNGDSRLVTFEYDADATYLVLTRPRAITHIQLAPGETVAGLAVGDSSNFQFSLAPGKTGLFVRPKYPSTETTATLVTNKRTYPLVMRATQEDGKFYQRVTWNFQDMIVHEIGEASVAGVSLGATSLALTQPPARAEALASLPPRIGSDAASALPIDKMHFGYQLEGDAEFRPLQVFDDGVRTYLRMPDGLQKLPALFALSPNGDGEIVNYSYHDKYIVVQGVNKNMLLKLGKAEVRVSKGAKKSLFNWGPADNG